LLRVSTCTALRAGAGEARSTARRRTKAANRPRQTYFDLMVAAVVDKRYRQV
jgi:hypothetical protein